jgi:DNA-directed RNA polymerase specialized sigma24 family protein
MEREAAAQGAFDGGVSAGARGFTARGEFDAFYARWMPRIYAFAVHRTAGRADAEAVTRAVLEAAVRAGLVGADADAAPRLLAQTRLELARRRPPLT